MSPPGRVSQLPHPDRGGDAARPVCSTIPPMLETISLIGMPGAGKSTVGVVLAKSLGLNFVDTDLLIQVRHGATLQQILEREGYLQLRRYEHQVLLDMPLEQRLIATGGSAIYSDRGMRRLAAAGPVVFLEVDLPEILARIGDVEQRGLARPPGCPLAEVYRERLPYYQRYAEFSVPQRCQTSVEATAGYIARWLQSR